MLAGSLSQLSWLFAIVDIGSGMILLQATLCTPYLANRAPHLRSPQRDEGVWVRGTINNSR